MSRFWPRILLTTSLSIFLLAFAAHAGTVHGTVINRTTGKPVPNIPLTLLNPTAGMVEVGSATSDAQGQFTVTSDTIGMGPVLIRATYHDNSFNTFLPPGRPNVDVDVYETSKDPKTINVPTHWVILQPNGDKLIGAEEYDVQNNSQPPQAYFRTEGNFEFAIPEKATLQNVATTALMGMAVTQASIDKGKGLFAIAYAFRPGETKVRLSYELPYPGNSLSVKLPATYGGMNLMVVAPPGVTLAADGLQSAGQEQGMMVYTHAPLAAKASLALNISGAGSQSAGAGGGQGQGGQQEGNSRTESQDIHAIPGRLDDLKWPLLVGLGALFAGGAILLSRKQVVVAGGPGFKDDDEAVERPKSKKKQAAQAKTASAAPAAPVGNSKPTVASVDAAVGASLDSLKDTIFRLELRKQAGTISEEEYARERARVEKLLRDLVKG